MRSFLRMLVVSLAISSIASVAQATDRVACKNLEMLEEVITWWVPVDEAEVFQANCSILTSEYIEVELSDAERSLVHGYQVQCANSQPGCMIWIVRVAYGDVIFYYEYGMAEAIPVDAFEEGVVGVEDHDGQILAYGLPSGIALPASEESPSMLAEAETVKP